MIPGEDLLLEWQNYFQMVIVIMYYTFVRLQMVAVDGIQMVAQQNRVLPIRQYVNVTISHTLESYWYVNKSKDFTIWALVELLP